VLLLAATVFVESATSSPDLLEILRDELPEAAFAATSTEADVLARLSSSRIVIRDRDGIVSVDRILEGARDAVVRVAALLVVEAVASYEPPLPPPAIEVRTATLAPAGEPDALAFSFGAGAGVAWWAGQPMSTIAVEARIELDPFSAGLVASISSVEASDAGTPILGVDPLIVEILAAASWSFVAIGPIDFGVGLMVGVGLESIEARAKEGPGGFAAAGPVETPAVFASPIVRGLVSIRAIVDSFFARLDGGLQVNPRRQSVELPAEFRDAEGGTVQPGVATPVVSLALGLVL
jgi:hypothetical protein